MNLLEIGSFATVWLLLWLVMACLLIVVYRFIRPPLFKLDAGYGGNVLLGLISLPMLFSLLCTMLLFFPYAENLFVGQHCHTNCGEHLPLLNSTLVAWPGLVAMTILLLVFSANTIRQIIKVRRLSLQLRMLSANPSDQPFKLLQNHTPIVFTVGFFRSSIYMSEGLRKACTKKELDIVFAHEQAHALRKDNFRVLLAKLLTIFIPRKFIATLYDDLQLLIESACDAYAAKQYGHLSVAETFLKIQKLVPKQGPLPFGVSSINGSEIEFRIKTLLDNEKLYQPSKVVTTLAIAALFILLVGSIDPLHHVVEWLLVGE